MMETALATDFKEFNKNMKIVPGDAFARTVPGSAATRPDQAQAKLQASQTVNNPGMRERVRNEVSPRNVEPLARSEQVRRDIPRDSFLDIKA